MQRVHLRFRVRRMMGGVAIAGIVMAFAKYLFIDNRPRDLLAAALGALDGHYTVYADGYSESKFRSIRVGMTARQVEEIMGPPLFRGAGWDGGQDVDVWHYTRAGKKISQGTACYWQRQVWFRNGAVYRTDSTYWID